MKSQFAKVLSRRQKNRDLILATKFLSTLSRSPDIWRVLARAAGYNTREHDRGWKLLHGAMGYNPDVQVEPLAQDEALNALDEWDGPAFERTRSAWRLAYPSQHDYMFNGLKAETGSGAMRSTRTYIDRAVTLRDGTDPRRAATREEDRKAVELLAERRIFDSEIEAHLESLLAQAAKAPVDEDSEEVVTDDSDLDEAAWNLHVFIVDWRGQARSVIHRGDHLIRLGLASRRSQSEDDDDLIEVEDDASDDAADDDVGDIAVAS